MLHLVPDRVDVLGLAEMPVLVVPNSTARMDSVACRWQAAAARSPVAVASERHRPAVVMVASHTPVPHSPLGVVRILAVPRTRRVVCPVWAVRLQPVVGARVAQQVVVPDRAPARARAAASNMAAVRPRAANRSRVAHSRQGLARPKVMLRKAVREDLPQARPVAQ